MHPKERIVYDEYCEMACRLLYVVPCTFNNKKEELQIRCCLYVITEEEKIEQATQRLFEMRRINDSRYHMSSFSIYIYIYNIRGE